MSRTDDRFLTQLQARSKKERTAILDGFVKTTGYHRKHTIAVLNRRPEPVQGPIRRPRRYFQRTGPRTPLGESEAYLPEGG